MLFRSSLVGPAGIYLSYLGNVMAAEIAQAPSMEGPWTTYLTSAQAQPITAQDASSLNLYVLNGGAQIWALGGAGYGGTVHRSSSNPDGGFVWDQFKLDWTHDPSLGQYVRIRILKGSTRSKYSPAAGKYEFKLYYPTDTVVSNTITVQNPTSFVYNGVVNKVNPPSFDIAAGWQIGRAHV